MALYFHIIYYHKMKKQYLLLFFLLLANILSAQNKIDSAKSKIAKNTFFTQWGEFGVSINYDRIIFKKNNNKLSIRVGTCPFLISKGTFPNGIDMQYFYGEKHHIGIAIGTSYINGIDDLSAYGNDQSRFAALFFCSRINYRYQRPKGGVFIQCGVFIQNQIAKLYSYTDTRNSWYYPMNKLLPSIGLGYTF
jgi:hypothetical protein